MTDGGNTIFHEDQTTDSDYLAHEDSEQNQEGDPLTLELCTNIKNDGIELYTIAFDISNSEAKSVMTECANSPDNYFDASNAEGLKQAFNTISSQVTEMRLME